jgi:hypothetical protein
LSSKTCKIDWNPKQKTDNKRKELKQKKIGENLIGEAELAQPSHTAQRIGPTREVSPNTVSD